MAHREAVSTETLENLLAAYNCERNASARYTAFAVQADKEELHGVASMFRAVAHSEQVHATNHARVLRRHGADLELHVLPLSVRTTNENLALALKCEQDEHDQMYPAYIEQAHTDRWSDAASTFQTASQAEKAHALMFAGAIEELRDLRDRAEYFVCMSCGWVSTGRNFRKCSLCSNTRDGFDRIE